MVRDVFQATCIKIFKFYIEFRVKCSVFCIENIDVCIYLVHFINELNFVV